VPSKLPAETEQPPKSRTALGSTVRTRLGQVGRELRKALNGRTVWIGFLFALTGPACFKAFEVIIGPFLIDRAWTVFEVGRFTALVMIGMMVLGSLVGGVLADRFSRRGFLAGAMLLIVSSLTALALTDIAMQHKPGMHLPVLIATTSFGIGIFTVAMYAMFMDLTSPALAATQFSAYMGATNGCESWSTYAIGILIVSYGYPVGILTLCAVSILALPLLFLLPGTREQEGH
jgi:predicted MFS family arabinose efflux permease